MREFALELRKSRFFHFFGGSGGFPGGPDLEIGVSGSGTRFRGSGTRFRGPEPEFRGPGRKTWHLHVFSSKVENPNQNVVGKRYFFTFSEFTLSQNDRFRGSGTRIRGPESGSRDSISGSGIGVPGLEIGALFSTSKSRSRKWSKFEVKKVTNFGPRNRGPEKGRKFEWKKVILFHVGCMMSNLWWSYDF